MPFLNVWRGPRVVVRKTARPITKHGEHDQSDHGNWAHGGGVAVEGEVREAASGLSGKYVAVPIHRGPGPVMSRAEAQEWAKDSKLPGPYYHGGTGASGLGARIWEDPRSIDAMGRGYYVAPSSEGAGMFGNDAAQMGYGSSGVTREVYLNVENPMKFGTAEYMEVYRGPEVEALREQYPEMYREQATQVVLQRRGVDALYDMKGNVAVFDARKVAVTTDEPNLRKHGEHDQSSHGNRDGAGWASSGAPSWSDIEANVDRPSSELTGHVVAFDPSAMSSTTAGQFRGTHIGVNPQMWDEDTREGRQWLLAHETGHAVQAAFVGGRNILEVPELEPFRIPGTERGVNGPSYSNWVPTAQRIPGFPMPTAAESQNVAEFIADHAAEVLLGREESSEPARQALAAALRETAERIGLLPASVRKHGEHDQSEHGNWARGGADEDISADVPDYETDTDTPEWEAIGHEVDSQGIGNCYQAAVTLLFDAERLGLENARVVQATVMGQGEVEGIRFGHSWVEADAVVDGQTFRVAYDWSSGARHVYPAEVYRILAKAEDIHEYDRDEAYAEMSRTMKYGAWSEEVASAYHNGD